MQEITGKSKPNCNTFPKSINVNSMKNNSHMAEEFNKYFTNKVQIWLVKYKTHLKHII